MRWGNTHRTLTAVLVLVSLAAAPVLAAQPGASVAAAPRASAQAADDNVRPPAKSAPAASAPLRAESSETETLILSGTVTDSATGWPLYAAVTIQECPSCGVIWTDPATGHYSVALPVAGYYTVSCGAWVAGYGTDSQSLGPLVNNTTLDLHLAAAQTPCSAPGYENTGGLLETFDSGALPSGWTVVDNASTGQTWTFDNAGGRDNLTGGSGSFAIVDSDHLGPGGYQDTELRTPLMNFSSHASVTLSFKTDFFFSGSEVADVDVSANGPSGPWVNVWEKSEDYRGPATVTLDISSIAAGHSNVMVRFHYYNASWAWWWEVDDVEIGPPACVAPASGGLVVGNVTDANTQSDMPGATVKNLDNGAVTGTSPTADPATGDAFFVFYSPAGTHTFQGGGCAAFLPDSRIVTVPDRGTVRQDFSLGAGRFMASPSSLSASVVKGSSSSLTFDLSNVGSLTAHYTLSELGGRSPSAVLAKGAPEAAAPSCFTGVVERAWPSHLSAAWGIAYDSNSEGLWVANPGPSWGGDDQIYEFDQDGVLTGRSWDMGWPHFSGPADLAFDWNTGMIWAMNVYAGVANCIYEIDPASGPTGTSVCPGGATGFSSSQRGLAFDPDTDTYFSAGITDETIHHFSAAGAILDEAYVGIPIAGLAYNPATHHLFAVDSDAPTRLYVLDAAAAYATLAQYTISGFSDYGGAGLAIDCDGNLWAVDQVTGTVYELESGEPTNLCAGDISWLSESPVIGVLDPGTTVPVTVTFDTAGLSQVGTYRGKIKVGHDTPYRVADIPVTLTVVYAPVAATASSNKTGGAAPLAVSFTGTASGGDGGPYLYEWNFGDGSPHASAQNPLHVYASAGLYPVTFKATDGHGNFAADGHLSITVAPPPVVTGVAKKGNPFRLKISGNNLHPGCIVKIDGAAVPLSQWKSASLVVAKKGRALKAMVPKGVAVHITVTNVDDGGVSAAFTYTR